MSSFTRANRLGHLLSERNYSLGVDLADFVEELDLDELATELDERLADLDPNDLPPFVTIGEEIEVMILGLRSAEYRGAPAPIGLFVIA